MEKSEFEEKMREHGFVKLSSVNEENEKITRYVDTERLDIYGIYQNKKGMYIVLFKAAERSISRRIAAFKAEERAYAFVLKDIENDGQHKKTTKKSSSTEKKKKNVKTSKNSSNTETSQENKEEKKRKN